MTDTPHHIFARQMLSATGWQQDVCVTLDDAGCIATLQENASAQGASTYDCVVPGMPNLHSHAFQRAMAGLSERRSSVGKNSSAELSPSRSEAERGANVSDSFWSWREVMYDFVQKLTPEQLEAIARHLYIEMLKSGYTAVGEFHYVHHQPDGTPYAQAAEMVQRVIAAAGDTGIAITPLPVLYMHSDFGAKPPADGQQRFIHTVDHYLRLLTDIPADHPSLQRGVAFHSLRAVSPEAMQEVLDTLSSIRLGQAPVHIHIAEQEKEVADCKAWSGQRPVAWLLEHMPVDARWCLVHATHLHADEVRELAYSGAVAGLCPTTEANLGDGIFPAASYQMQHHGHIGIGSDSHICISPWEELRLLEYSQRLALRKRAILTDGTMSVGRYLYDNAVRGGAQALGLGSGMIEPGARADFVSLDLSNPLFAGKQGDAILDTAIFGLSHPPVQDVYVGGKHVIVQGRHAQEEKSGRDFAKAVSQLQQ